jgi:acyl carrier protein
MDLKSCRMRAKLEAIVNDAKKLCNYLKEMIIDTLKLEEIAADDIEDDAPLFKEGLGLDSIDALELVVAIEKHFNIIIEDEDVGKEAFGSVNILSQFIQREFKDKEKNSMSAAG